MESCPVFKKPRTDLSVKPYDFSVTVTETGSSHNCVCLLVCENHFQTAAQREERLVSGRDLRVTSLQPHKQLLTPTKHTHTHRGQRWCNEVNAASYLMQSCHSEANVTIIAHSDTSSFTFAPLSLTDGRRGAERVRGGAGRCSRWRSLRDAFTQRSSMAFTNVCIRSTDDVQKYSRARCIDSPFYQTRCESRVSQWRLSEWLIRPRGKPRQEHYKDLIFKIGSNQDLKVAKCASRPLSWMNIDIYELKLK